MTTLADRHPVHVTRDPHGGWLAGVCAGLAAFRERPVAVVRVVFIALALLGGIGLAVYLACWLILPAAGTRAAGDAARTAGPESADGHPAGVVLLARVAGSCVGLTLLTLGSALATVFGLRWLVLVAAALLVLLMYVPPARVTFMAGLLGVVALALPALAVSAAAISLVPQVGPKVATPAGAATLGTTTYRSGLGTMLIDLRHTALPSSGQVDLHIRAGIRRTIVALPHDRCVHVAVHYAVRPFDANLAALLDNRSSAPSNGLILFNRLYGTQRDRFTVGPTGGSATGPTLDIDFNSQGGSLQVRDYPDTVNPQVDPDWPGLAVQIDPRPLRLGATKQGYAAELAYWRHRVSQEHVWVHKLNTLLPGPCGA
jgi:phage shock protein PspC (stress-responsive transcriptional regulator)